MSFSELEFLPVITPNDKDKQDPKIFANRVRNVFSEHLRIPVSDVSLKDARNAQEKEKEKRGVSSKKEKDDKNFHTSTTSVDFVGNLTFGI